MHAYIERVVTSNARQRVTLTTELRPSLLTRCCCCGH